MDRRDANYNYYEAHAKTISTILDKITSSDNNADIIQRLRDNDPTFDYLQISGDNDYNDENYDFSINEGDNLGWLGYYVGNSHTLKHLWIESLPETIGVNRFGAFIEGLNRNRSIETLYIGADLGSASFRQMGDFFRNNNLRELSFGSMDNIGIESARSIAFMLSQCQQSNLQILSLEESNASEEVLAEIVAAISMHSQLVELNLDGNNLYRDGSVALGKALQACNNPRLQKLVLWWNFIDDEGLHALADGTRNCHNLSQLHLAGNDLITADGFRSLSTLFQSDCCQLKYLDLDSMNMGDDGARVIAAGLAGLNSLEELHLSDNAIGDDGARALVAGMANLQSLKTLYLSSNTIGDDGASALAAGLINLHSLEKIYFRNNSIGDLGLQALADGLIHSVNLKHFNLSNNRAITALGLGSLSTLLQSESCSLTEISIWGIPFGDDGAVALADALKGNTSMKELFFDPESARITSVGWSAFSKLLCDTSSVNATYLSNHSLTTVGIDVYDDDVPPDVTTPFLELNKHPAEHVAIHKILKSHPDFDIEPFFEWKLKLLPLVVSWFERVGILVDEHSWISDESAEEIQSRQLSTMYNFVRGMPLVAIDSYRSRNSAATLAQTRKRKVDQLS
jgi:Ran GTPase-activating protein (RanGAP) involved in mRNA processing and transport